MQKIEIRYVNKLEKIRKRKLDANKHCTGHNLITTSFSRMLINEKEYTLSNE